MKFKWTDLEQKAFGDIKRAFTQDNLLAYTEFNKRFDIHMDASDYQLGAVIRNNWKPNDFYRHRLTGPQTQYAATEKQLLSIVKALKEFHTILLDQKLKIYTNHTNLTCRNFNTNRVLRWRLIL